jgi:hypothetical protein
MTVCSNRSRPVPSKSIIFHHIGRYIIYTRVYSKVSGLITKYKLTTIKTRWEATQRIMAAKLTRLTQKSDTTAPSGRVPFVVLAPDGHSGNFWIHLHIAETASLNNVSTDIRLTVTYCWAISLWGRRIFSPYQCDWSPVQSTLVAVETLVFNIHFTVSTLKVKAKLKLSIYFNQAPRHPGVLGWRYSSNHFLTSALDKGEWLASRTGRFAPKGKSPWYSLDVPGPFWMRWWREKFPASAGNRTLEPR